MAQAIRQRNALAPAVLTRSALEVRISRREGRRNRGGTPLRSITGEFVMRGVDMASRQMQDYHERFYHNAIQK